MSTTETENACRRAADIDWSDYLVEPGAPRWHDFRRHFPACATCSAEVASWTRFEAALRLPRATGSLASAHLGLDLLSALIETPGSLEDAVAAEADSHLASCARCRDELAAARGVRESLRASERIPAAAAAVDARPSFAQMARDALQAILARPGLLLPTAAAIAGVLVLYATNPATVPTQATPAQPPGELARVSEAPAPLAQSTARERLGQQDSETLMAAVELERSTAAGLPQNQRERESIAQSSAIARSNEPHTEPVAAEILLASADRFVPPDYNFPMDVQDEIGRIAGLLRSGTSGLPEPLPLVPLHTGRTVSPAPALHWFLPESTHAALAFTLVDSSGETTLVEFVEAGPHEAGFHAVMLEDHGVTLETDLTYHWYISVLVAEAPGRGDQVAGATVKRVSAPATLDAELRAAGAGDAVLVYSRRGLWYDALGDVSTEALSLTTSDLHRRRRISLLEQVGLDAAAKFEREGARQ